MRTLILAIAGATTIACGIARAADGLDRGCASCHALSRSTDALKDRILTRKAPDLWYAGSKFNADWLLAWLQDPKPLRPAGYPYFKTIKEGQDHDEPDPEKIAAHPKLNAAQAAAAVSALMSLKAPADLIPVGAFNGDMSAARMGALAFNKLRGCTSCHQGEGGQGGLSGPELTDAGLRLQPDFIAAFTTDPQHIDPNIWMPSPKLKDADIQKLTAYLVEQRRGTTP